MLSKYSINIKVLQSNFSSVVGHINIKKNTQKFTKASERFSRRRLQTYRSRFRVTISEQKFKTQSGIQTKYGQV